jgi:ferric-dicitrate binding protein FerR (iron transport regulator)
MTERNHTDLDLKAKVELAEWMIGLLLSDEQPVDVHSVDEIMNEVRSYLADDRDSELKQEVLDKLFLAAFQLRRPDDVSTESALVEEMWPQIAGTLGIDPNPDHRFSTKKTDVSIRPLRRPMWSRVGVRVAAAVIPILMIAGGVWMWNQRVEFPTYQSALANVNVSVPEEGQKRIVLPDGSQVWINSSTTIAYNDDFSKERTVTLDGEAFFSVVHDSLSPFRVKTADMVIEVLGTKFNVHSRSDESIEQVILTEGSVEVNMPHNEEMQLTPGERLTYDTESSKASVDQIDVETIASWRVTNLRMVETPLPEALERIAIYYGRTLSVTGEFSTGDMVDLSHLGRFSVQQVLDVVRDITNNSFDYQITQDSIKITPVSRLKE